MKITKIPVLMLSFFLFACAQHDVSNDPVPAPLPDQSNATDVSANILTPAPTEAPSSVVADDSVRINNTVYFAFDKSEVTAEEGAKLDALVSWLKKHPFSKITVEGYTDIYGTVEYNLALGERRANAVKEFFLRNGIGDARIKVVSYGKDHLADQDVQWKNRRAIAKVGN